MKLKVTFREYDLPSVDPETKKEERGEYLGSFSEEVEGKTVADIFNIATQKAEAYSKERQADVRVWEVPVTITPLGSKSR
jgi:hypothetical protein